MVLSLLYDLLVQLEAWLVLRRIARDKPSIIADRYEHANVDHDLHMKLVVVSTVKQLILSDIHSISAISSLLLLVRARLHR